MMKALVTGASGFTGGYLVDNLLKNGYSVRAFVRPSSQIKRFQNLPVELVFGDLLDADQVNAAVKGVDVVYHLAALYRQAGFPDSVYYDVNVNGTENLLKASLTHHIKRFLHCSTGGVHGHVTDPPGDEFSPFNPGDIYQKSKLEGEQLALHYFTEYGLPVTIVRPIGIYGPGDTRMLKMYKMVQKGRFILFGGGDVLYHLTYVTDTVEGFRLAAENPNSIGEAYILGGKDYTTLAGFAATIAEVLDVPPPRFKPPVWPLYGAAWICEKVCIPLRIQPPIFRRRVDIFTKDRAFSIKKAEEELGFEPRVSMKEGITKTAQWYKENGLLNE
ncbi:NAD-dependent epimerase/dehydratase family protein [candidate division KSB1 bacterium]|nr:NAD-dependent epimerase/dehydratase family protein [candidate division KSB1 bacterium]